VQKEVCWKTDDVLLIIILPADHAALASVRATDDREHSPELWQEADRAQHQSDTFGRLLLLSARLI
jgi:hypothetical protein